MVRNPAQVFLRQAYFTNICSIFVLSFIYFLRLGALTALCKLRVYASSSESWSVSVVQLNLKALSGHSKIDET